MPTLQELQAAEAAQGAAKLRAFQLEFAHVLRYCPLLAQEVQEWLSTSDIDLLGMAERLAPKLEQTNVWVVQYESLGAELQSTKALAAYLNEVKLRASNSTLQALSQNFSSVLTHAQGEVRERRRQEELARQQREQEAAEKKKREEEKAAEKKRRLEAEVAEKNRIEVERIEKIRREELNRQRQLEEGRRFRLKIILWGIGSSHAFLGHHL